MQGYLHCGTSWNDIVKQLENHLVPLAWPMLEKKQVGDPSNEP